MKHMYALEQPICGQMAAADVMAANVRVVYGTIDCPDCLRRLVSEADARTTALRDLLAKAEEQQLS